MALTNHDASLTPIFIGGAGRSGTTLLRVILDSHPRISCGPELKITPVIAQLWADFQTKYAPFLKPFLVGPAEIDHLFRAFISGLLEPFRSHGGKPRVAEKSPNNVFFFHHLFRIFPQSPFVHIIRDGRDVVASLLQMDWQGMDGKPVPYTRDPVEAARYWVSAVTAGRSFAASSAGASRYHEIRYETIVASPEPELQRLFEFLGEAWDPRVLEFHRLPHILGPESSAAQVSRQLYRTAVGRWKNELPDSVRAAIRPVMGDLLVELGYASPGSW